jgi:hypothetical protein
LRPWPVTLASALPTLPCAIFRTKCCSFSMTGRGCRRRLPKCALTSRARVMILVRCMRTSKHVCLVHRLSPGRQEVYGNHTPHHEWSCIFILVTVSTSSIVNLCCLVRGDDKLTPTRWDMSSSLRTIHWIRYTKADCFLV